MSAIILTIYKTNAAVLSAKRPQSIHKIPDVLHILPLKLWVTWTVFLTLGRNAQSIIFVHFTQPLPHFKLVIMFFLVHFRHFHSFDDFTKILFLPVLLHYLKRGKFRTQKAVLSKKSGINVRFFHVFVISAKETNARKLPGTCPFQTTYSVTDFLIHTIFYQYINHTVSCIFAVIIL